MCVSAVSAENQKSHPRGAPLESPQGGHLNVLPLINKCPSSAPNMQRLSGTRMNIGEKCDPPIAYRPVGLIRTESDFGHRGDLSDSVRSGARPPRRFGVLGFSLGFCHCIQGRSGGTGIARVADSRELTAGAVPVRFGFEASRKKSGPTNRTRSRTGTVIAAYCNTLAVLSQVIAFTL